jgi:hypothetical protein
MLADVLQGLQADRIKSGNPVGPTSRRLYELLRDGWLQQRILTYDEPYSEFCPITPQADDVSIVSEDSGCWFRVSEIARLCPRLVSLARRQPIQEIFQIDELWRFELGTAYHRAIQGALSSLPNSPVLGWWQGHDATGRRWIRRGPNGTLCRKPAEPGWGYYEVLLQDPVMHRRGHPDMVLEWPDGRELQEFKSIDERMIDAINPAMGGQPMAEHREQVHGYMDLLGLDRTRITYFAKSSSPLDLIMFEHVVERDEAIIQEQRARLQACAEARENATKLALPAKLVECTKGSDRRVQRCAGGKRCLKAL